VAVLKAAKILNPDRKFYSITELLSTGLTYYKINRLVTDGRLTKLNKEFYENMSYKGEESDFAFSSVYAPKGVICMMSAARHYGLTTFLPDGVDIAIERNMKISTLPDCPQVKVWYFPEKRYSAGITSSSDGACEFPIYDLEKTVVDILYYRTKVGIEENKEVLKNYLRREDRDLIKLHRYADDLGCKKILGTYLEVLI
jgi:predicted transcriptional regulator of viral defense system